MPDQGASKPHAGVASGESRDTGEGPLFDKLLKEACDLIDRLNESVRNDPYFEGRTPFSLDAMQAGRDAYGDLSGADKSLPEIVGVVNFSSQPAHAPPAVHDINVGAGVTAVIHLGLDWLIVTILVSIIEVEE